MSIKESARTDLLEGSVGKALISFGVPLFLNYLLQALYGSADAYIVSHFSDFADITGVTLGSQITYILTAMISGFGSGATVLVGQLWGAKRRTELNHTVETVIIMFLALALTAALLMAALTKPILKVLAVPAEAYVPTRNYLLICLSGTMFVFLYNAISAVMQALGDSKHPLYYVIISCAVNIILDLALIAGCGLGAAGAAIATVVAQFISFMLSFIRLLKMPQFTIIPKKIHFHRSEFDRLWQLGLPYAVQRVIVALSFTAVSGFVNHYGLIASSASGIVSKINNFATLPFTAIQAAMVTMCSQCFGAGKKDRVKDVLRVGWLMNFVVGICMFSLAQIIPGSMVRIFNEDAELVNMAVPFLRCYAAEYIIMPTNYSLHAIITGAGHTVIPMFDGMLSAVILRVPLCALLSSFVGFPGIALGSALATLGAFFAAIWFYRNGAADPAYRFEPFGMKGKS